MNLLKEKGNAWKDILRENCIVLTQCYEKETDHQFMNTLVKRKERVEKLYEQVS